MMPGELEQPGEIRDRRRIRQICSFRGFRFGTISPTDLDALIEFRRLAYVFFEFKYGAIPIGRGQMLALTELADDVTRAGKEAIVIVAEHDIADPAADIIAAETIVREVYYRGDWFALEGGRGQWTAYQVADLFLRCVMVARDRGGLAETIIRRDLLEQEA